jgi:hypothetical protein
VAAFAEAMRNGGLSASVPCAVEVLVVPVSELEPQAHKAPMTRAGTDAFTNLNIPISMPPRERNIPSPPALSLLLY